MGLFIYEILSVTGSIKLSSVLKLLKRVFILSTKTGMQNFYFDNLVTNRLTCKQYNNGNVCAAIAAAIATLYNGNDLRVQKYLSKYC